MSLSINNHFTLIEARYNDDNRSRIKEELRDLGKNSIDTLHITSWDDDHCRASELMSIIQELRPNVIELPGYMSNTYNAHECLEIIKSNPYITIVSINGTLVRNEKKEKYMGKDIFYGPYRKFDSSNDNSVVKFFRRGSFKVLSLGDCEAKEISEYLQNEEILQNEVDVLILSHHGSVNSIISPEFLDAIRPKVAVCPVNYANNYGLPNKKIEKWINDRGIKYLSTKMGDVLIRTKNKFSYNVVNFAFDNERVVLSEDYEAKTYYPNDDD